MSRTVRHQEGSWTIFGGAASTYFMCTAVLNFLFSSFMWESLGLKTKSAWHFRLPSRSKALVLTQFKVRFHGFPGAQTFIYKMLLISSRKCFDDGGTAKTANVVRALAIYDHWPALVSPLSLSPLAWRKIEGPMVWPWTPGTEAGALYGTPQLWTPLQKVTT